MGSMDSQFNKIQNTTEKIPVVEETESEDITHEKNSEYSRETPNKNEAISQEENTEYKYNEKEDTPENKEKRDRIIKISEKTQEEHNNYKELLMSLEERSNKVFYESQRKLSKILRYFPNIIKPNSLKRIDEGQLQIKNGFVKLNTIEDFHTTKNQKLINSLQVENTSLESIDYFEKTMDSEQLHKYVYERINKNLERLEHITSGIPDIEKPIKNKEESEKIKEKVEKSEFIQKIKSEEEFMQ